MYRILVAIDANEDRTREQTEYVRSQPMDRDEVEVKVVHVDEADYEGAPPRDFEDIQSATTAVERISDAGFRCEGEKHEGLVAQTIIEAAEEFDADEIVMAGRKRSGVAKVIMGSVTRDVLRSTDRAVVVVG